MVEKAPRYVGEMQINRLDSYSTRVSNLMHSKGTYEYFINESFYNMGRPIEVKAGESFKGLTVNLKKGEKLIVELGKWNFNGSKIEILESKTVTNGMKTAVNIPEGEKKFYFYRLALMDAYGKITAENYFPLYTPSNENNMIATASKQVYKRGETASIYYENLGMSQYETGTYYQVYRKTDSGWVQEKQDMSFADQLLSLPPFSLHLEHVRLNGLSKGTYKVLKAFTRNNGQEDNELLLGVEFEIE